MCRHHDDPSQWREFVKAGEQRQVVEVWKTQIQHDDAEPVARASCLPDGVTSGSGFDDRIAVVTQRFGDGPSDERFVVDYEDAGTRCFANGDTRGSGQHTRSPSASIVPNRRQAKPQYMER